TTDEIDDADRILLESAARVVLSEDDSSLAQALERGGDGAISMPAFGSAGKPVYGSPQDVEWPRRDLIFSNGQGGFAADGREHVITSSRSQMTAAPSGKVLD